MKKMIKMYFYIFPLIVLIQYPSTLMAAQVEGSTEFTAGETLEAKKLNTNLNALQNAINDNDLKSNAHIDDTNLHHNRYTDAESVDAVKDAGVEELTGGLIKTTFTQSFTNQDILIKDGDLAGTTSIIAVPDASASLSSISIFLRITALASPPSVLDIIIIDPSGAEFTLQQGDTGSVDDPLLQQSWWSHNSAIPVGNLGDWIGKNPVGNWTLKIIDNQPDQLAEDVRVEDWSLTFGGTSSVAENNNTTELSGGLIVKGDFRVESPSGFIRLVKMRLWHADRTIYFLDAEGVTHSLGITDPPTLAQNAFIYYNPAFGGAGKDAAIFLNIESSPSITCTLVGNDDDLPTKSKGLYWATDSGNSHPLLEVWGNRFTKTFMLMRDRDQVTTDISKDIPIEIWSSYVIICF